jgi:allantoin racemase
MDSRTKRIKMILPVPLPRQALDHFAEQIPSSLRRRDVAIDFVGCRAGATWLDSDYEATLADAFVLDAGARAEEEGYDLVCSFSTSDSGVSALRSRLKIPVVGAAMSAFSLAAQLGQRFSVLTMYEPWRRDLVEVVRRCGFSPRLASVRSVNVRPDTHELLSGKEEVVFGALQRAALAAIAEDGADVIVIGSTTMYQSHAYLTTVLPCPVINPGLAAYKVCENLLDLELAHSKIAYPSPEIIRDGLFEPIAPVYRNNLDLMGRIVKLQRAPLLRDQVVVGLLQELQDGRLAPGERLTEEHVAAVLGVSRTPVREALGILAQRGLLSRRRGSGFAVSKPSLKSLEDTFELRRLLEPYAARRAASEINAGELAELRKAIGRLRKMTSSGKASSVAKINRDIRRLLFGVSRNASLAQAIDQLSDHVYLLGILTLKEKSVRALLLARHESIFKALSNRDKRAAEKAVMDYLSAAHRSATAALAAVDSHD